MNNQQHAVKRPKMYSQKNIYFSMIRSPFSRTPAPIKLEMVVMYQISEQTMNKTKPV